MADAKASESPTVTKVPASPFNKVSLGPSGQSVEIMGTPIACASIITCPGPSQLMFLAFFVLPPLPKSTI